MLDLDDAPKPDTPADGLARAARAACLAPIIVVTLNCFSNTATQQLPTLGVAIATLQLILLIAGIAAGLYAVFGARKIPGGSGVIPLGMIGIILCSGILTLNLLFLSGKIKPPAMPSTMPTTAPTTVPTSAPTSPLSA